MTNVVVVCIMNKNTATTAAIHKGLFVVNDDRVVLLEVHFDRIRSERSDNVYVNVSTVTDKGYLTST